ncbi:hypothetical protein BD626DRAFT_563760 [Schizophyllum amplum]|uniref:Uncharacterized protein n=1 Tax=Schizophyllum amplum TaxID=97359 RepID=A0A550CZ59_9AGAR|nr:hypothetical protein BD626DRAFT_563760 [Auriculariopsis ampla]
MLTVARVSSWLLVIVPLLVQAVSSEDMNSQRCARGLPPSAQANLRRSSATERAESSHPPTTYTGLLEVHDDESGNVLGFVSATDIFTREEGLRVSISTNNLCAPFDILAINAEFSSPHYVGIAGGPLKHNSINTAAFTNVDQTAAGSVDGRQSAIWTMNPHSKALKAHLINPDGSRPKTTLAYDARANAFFFVGDLEAYNDVFYYYIAGAVTLYLVD